MVTSKLVITINTTYKLVQGNRLGTTYQISAAISVLPTSLSKSLGVPISVHFHLEANIMCLNSHHVWWCRFAQSHMQYGYLPLLCLLILLHKMY